MFARGVAAEALPPTPAVFGHQNLVPAKGWGMLGNDQCGNCTIAGPMHVEMLWNAVAGRRVRFTPLDAVDDYGSVSGYVPGNPLTDLGCDMVTVAKYWQATGMRDCADTRHRIGASLSIDGSAAGAPNLSHVYLSAYLFGAAGIGITLPQSADDQFTKGEPWTDVGSASTGEYHFVPVIARGPLGLGFVTWGEFCWMSEGFFQTNCREALVYLTQEDLVAGKSPEGYDYSALLADLPEAA